jgi:hypothetical protein
MQHEAEQVQVGQKRLEEVEPVVEDAVLHHQRHAVLEPGSAPWIGRGETTRGGELHLGGEQEVEQQELRGSHHSGTIR